MDRPRDYFDYMLFKQFASRSDNGFAIAAAAPAFGQAPQLTVWGRRSLARDLQFNLRASLLESVEPPPPSDFTRALRAAWSVFDDAGCTRLWGPAFLSALQDKAAASGIARDTAIEALGWLDEHEALSCTNDDAGRGLVDRVAGPTAFATLLLARDTGLLDPY